MQLKYKVIQSSRIQWQQENKVHLSAAKKSSRGNDSKGSKETIKNNCNCIYNKVISTTTLRAAEDVLGSARILVTGRKRWAQSLKCIEDTLGNMSDFEAFELCLKTMLSVRLWWLWSQLNCAYLVQNTSMSKKTPQFYLSAGNLKIVEDRFLFRIYSICWCKDLKTTKKFKLYKLTKCASLQVSF